MTEQFANAPQSTLAVNITAASTTISMISAATFSATGTFRLLIDSEYLIVTAVSGNTFTVTRGAEGSTAAPHLVGAIVRQIVTAGAITQLKSDLTPLTSASFTQPSPLTNTGVAVSFTSTNGFVAGDWLWIQGGGYYSILSVGGPTAATLSNLGASTSAAAGATVPSGASVVLTGPPSDPNYFDVRLYGASPSDIGPGLSSALTAASANKAGSVVFVPALLNGQPWLLVTAVTFNAAFATGDLRVIGNGAWIQDNGIAAFSAFMTLSTVAGSITVDGIVFSGRPGGGGSVGNVLNITSCSRADVRNCQFSGCAGMLGAVVNVNAVQVCHVHDCIFGACGTTSTSSGTISLSGGVDTAHFENIFFTDGVGIYSTNSPGTTAHIYLQTARVANIVNCFFDEIATNDVFVDAASGDVRHVTIRSCVANRPISGTPFVAANMLQSLTIDNFAMVLATGTGGTIAFDVTNCGDFTLRHTRAIAGAPNQIASRAGNGAIRLEQASGWTITTTGTGFAYPSNLLTVDGIDVPYRVNRAGSPYTLLGSQLNVLADVSGGAIALTVPATTTVADGRRMTLAVPAGNAAVNSITLNRAGSDTLQDPANISAALGNFVTYATNGGSATWAACATEQQWRVVAKVA